MKNKIIISALLVACLLSTSCSKGNQASTTNESSLTIDESITVESITEEVIVTESVKLYTNEDKRVAQWFYNYLTDAEEFDDITNYQYYARSLGLDKDYFLSVDMWEVYYSEEINRNRDVDNTVIYLIRLNPYKLLDVYAENNDSTVENLCSELGVSKAQLYYNWGYTYAWDNYAKDYADGKALYSEKENDVFGVYSKEDRAAVMKTHMITIDFNEDTTEYSSDVSNDIKYLRRDLVENYSGNSQYYSNFSYEEKEATYTVNGIGIRCVIPLLVPNAYQRSMKTEYETDYTVTPMINYSPYSYGCNGTDLINIIDIINDLYPQEND